MPQSPRLQLGRALAGALQVLLWVPLLLLLALAALPRVSSFDVLIVRGGSMQPAIAVGSAVVIDRGDRTPRVGAVATFHDPTSELVTHRIVAIDGSRIVTKGDANQAPDVTVRNPSDLVGTVVAAVPFAGYVLYALRQPVVFFLLLIGAGGYLIAAELRTIVGELRKMRRAGAR